MALSSLLRLTAYSSLQKLYAPSHTHFSNTSYQPDWPLTSSKGRQLIKRQFHFCGYTVHMPGRIQWVIPEAGTDWHREFFAYGWLQSVMHSNSEKVAGSFAREFVNGFTLIKRQDERHPCAWESDVAGQRLAHWLYYQDFILRGGSKAFSIRYYRALLDHVQKLYYRLWRTPLERSPNALKGLIAAACLLPDCRFLLPELCVWLDDLLVQDMHDDGSHRSASPSHHLHFLLSCIEIHTMLTYSQQTDTMPDSMTDLRHAIARLSQVLTFYCHGDNRLALLHDNIMDSADLITHAIHKAGKINPKRTSLTSLPNAGYIRLDNHTACLFVHAMSRIPHTCGAIEFSHKAERIFVHCGTYIGMDSDWHKATRQASAYTTLSGFPENSVLPEPTLRPPEHQLEEYATYQQLHIRHAPTPNILHNRTLQLTRHGDKLSGTDAITTQDNVVMTRPLYARFHLHPDIRCTMRDDAWLLSTLSGQQWCFSCSVPEHISIEESVYLGEQGKPKKTRQLVITIAPEAAGTPLQWELRHIA